MRCPRGTPSQIKANLAYIQNLSPCFDESLSWVLESNKGHVFFGEDYLMGELSGLDYQSTRADKRSPPTSRDQLVYSFISCCLDIVLKSWEGKPCLKPFFVTPYKSLSEVLGEDELELPPGSGSCSESVTEIKNNENKAGTDSKECTTPFNKLNNSVSDFSTDVDESSETWESIDDWQTFVPDENVHFVFLNGVWYKGRVSRKLMEGEGTYFWEDGSLFKGEFVGGCITGKGRLEFPDLSVYEGELYKAFRHGEGMYSFADSPVMYSGQWWLGKKHGEGLIMYEDPSLVLNFYKGHWENGEEEGFGLRQYPSGSMYIGNWSKGKRHGKGIMLWSNRDIYQGEWKEGLMDGYGEYTWNGFLNESLCYPSSNIYRGFWTKGKRDGEGSFEVKSGGVIETVWKDNIKEGPGTVICSNGYKITSERLFSKDKQALFNDKEDTTGLLIKDQMNMNIRQSKYKRRGDDNLLAYLKSIEKAKAISIPICSPSHTIDLRPHTNKLIENMKVRKSPVKVSLNFQMIRPIEDEQDHNSETEVKFDSDQLSARVLKEEKYLRNSIITNMSTLKECYKTYATLTCPEPPSFKCLLLRIFLWELLIDSSVPSPDLSLVDIDDILDKEEYLLLKSAHDPFERLFLWQFIHTLIILSWYLYGRFHFEDTPLIENKKVTDFLNYYGNSDCKMVLKTAFDYFLITDIIPVFQSRAKNKNKLEYDLAPLKAMYGIYRSLGEPHSARRFVNALCGKADWESAEPESVGYFEKLPIHKLEGKNALFIGSELSYLPKPEPFNHPEIIKMERNTVDTEWRSRLSCFRGLKAKRIIKCLSQVCTGIVSDECVVNMNRQLTFLEFYKVIILCTELMLKINVMKEMKEDVIKEHKQKMEEYQKLLSEYEKMKVSSVLSFKKSKTQKETSKKGKRERPNN